MPRYWVCTVEAMPRDPDVDFLAIDEVQLAADPERGHVFTDRLLHVRGQQETLLLGAQTMREAISDLIPGANFISRPRLSKLTYAGEKKITRLPPRTALVAFSASEVYAIAELIRRQRGGAAVVLGALSARARATRRWRSINRATSTSWSPPMPSAWASTSTSITSPSPAMRKFDGQVPPRADGRRARPDRRPRRPPHERRHLRRHRHGRSFVGRSHRAPRDAHLRSA